MKFDTVPAVAGLGRGGARAGPRATSRPADRRRLRAAWLEHKVLVFRGQRLDEEAQARFANYFGPPATPRPQTSAARNTTPTAAYC